MFYELSTQYDDSTHVMSNEEWIMVSGFVATPARYSGFHHVGDVSIASGPTIPRRSGRQQRGVTARLRPRQFVITRNSLRRYMAAWPYDGDYRIHEAKADCYSG